MMFCRKPHPCHAHSRTSCCPPAPTPTSCISSCPLGTHGSHPFPDNWLSLSRPVLSGICSHVCTFLTTPVRRLLLFHQRALSCYIPELTRGVLRRAPRRAAEVHIAQRLEEVASLGWLPGNTEKDGRGPRTAPSPPSTALGGGGLL